MGFDGFARNGVWVDDEAVCIAGDKLRGYLVRGGGSKGQGERDGGGGRGGNVKDRWRIKRAVISVQIICT